MISMSAIDNTSGWSDSGSWIMMSISGSWDSISWGTDIASSNRRLSVCWSGVDLSAWADSNWGWVADNWSWLVVVVEGA